MSQTSWGPLWTLLGAPWRPLGPRGGILSPGGPQGRFLQDCAAPGDLVEIWGPLGGRG